MVKAKFELIPKLSYLYLNYVYELKKGGQLTADYKGNDVSFILSQSDEILRMVSNSKFENHIIVHQKTKSKVPKSETK